MVMIMKNIIYFFIIVFSNTIGAISGMGGGVIIKPLFDLLNYDSVITISFYSSVGVFIMSIVSTIRQIQLGMKLDLFEILFLSFGSFLGGNIGDFLLNSSVIILGEKATKLIQIFLMIFMLLFAIISTKGWIRKYQNLSISKFILCGLILGVLSSFLGIGGGPINVSLLIMLFSFPIRKATVYSITTIFFSQLSKIISLIFISQFNQFDAITVIYIIIAAICGGMLGAKLSQLMSNRYITILFQIIVICVLLLNIYNGTLLLL